MFLGEHEHALDAKGRVILPAKFRDQLTGGAVVAKGIDQCLFVFPTEEFEQMAQRVQEMARRGVQEREAARNFFAGATEVVPDKQGRVPIPQNLRDYAGLDRDVVVSGQFTRIEIWDSARWRARTPAGDASLAAAEALADWI